MNLHPIDISIIVGYLVLCLVIGFFKYGKIRNIRDYTLGTKAFPTSVLIATTFATAISSREIVGNVGKIYELGLIFIIPLFFLPVRWLIITAIFIPNLERFRKLKFMSLSDIMEDFYGNNARWLSNFLAVISTIGITAVSSMAIGYLLHYFANISEITGMIIGVSVVTLYSAFGGVASVAFTDLFQFLIFFIALPIACFIGYHDNGSIQNIIDALPTTHLTIKRADIFFFFSLVLFYIIPYTGAPYIQRALMAKDKKQFTTTFVTVGVLFIPFLAMMSVIGLITYKLNPNINSNITLYYFVDHYLSSGIKGLVIAGILAIIMSTQDSYLNTASSIISRDICKQIWPNLNDKQQLLIARVSCIGIAVFSMATIFLKKGIMDIVWLVNNFWDPLITFPLLAGLMGARISNKTFNVLVISALTTTVITRFFTGVFDTRSLVVGVMTSILILYIGNRRYKKQHPELVVPQKPKTSFFKKIYTAITVDDFSDQPIHLISIILGLNFIIGVFFLYLNHRNFLNVSFVSMAVIFILLALNDIWSSTIKKYIKNIWKIILTFSLIIIPSYIVLATHFNILWVLNLLLSISLFFNFTNSIKATFISIIAITTGYLLSKYVLYPEVAAFTRTFAFSSSLFIIVTIIMKIHHSRQIASEVIKQLEARVNERTSELKKALAVKQEFLNKVSHEIRTPLHGIVGISTELDENYDNLSNEHRKKFIQLLSESSKRLQSYALSILDLSAIQKNKFTLDIAHNVDLEEIAKETISNAEPFILTMNKKLKVKLEMSETLPKIDCDPIKVAQILSNLLNNSIQYTEKGDIIVSIDSDKTFITIKVADNGIGIPDSEKKKIFEPFYEGVRTKTSAKGKGLGLAIVQEFVLLHKGTIKVINNKPKGSVFVITIPIKH